MGKENPFLHSNFSKEDIEVIPKNPQVLNALNPLIERREKINGYLPQGISEIPQVVGKLKVIHQEYQRRVEQFKPPPAMPLKDTLSLIYKQFNFLKKNLDEEERGQYNDGGSFIHKLYCDPEDKDRFGQWPAVWSYQFNFFSQNEFFKGKKDPFAAFLTFYEIGVKPLKFFDFKENENHALHILLKEKSNDQDVIICWHIDNEKDYSYYHFRQQNCDFRQEILSLESFKEKLVK